MQNLSSFDGAESPASREARPAVITAHSLSSRPSSSPARMKPEAQCLTARASGPVRRLSPATGTAGAAAPSGFGPQFGRHGAGSVFAAGRSCIRTEDGTVILFDRLTGRAVSALDRNTAEARLLHLAGGKSAQAG
ncbi:hypothetical protein A9K65_015125 [Mesorhizobium sp. WSM1497]|nr:hypothetical protein A9K65_015125 [Mesorhizobium sp. WSM1497]